MSEENNQLIAGQNNDFSKEDLERINAFMEKGLPGVSAVDEASLKRILDLYLSGKTYRQISKSTRIPKDVILFLSYKFNWYKDKQEYFGELEQNIKERFIETKLVSQNFLNDLIAFWHKRIGSNVTRFLAQGDERAAENINFKDVDRYLKTLEVLHKLTVEQVARAAKSNSSIGLNVGEGVTVKKIGENEVEITPKNKTLGEMLKTFADYRRQEEQSSKVVNKSDIKEETHKGEESEE